METVGEFFLTENVHFVLVVGGLGWILGICCLLLRYNDVQRPWVQRVCLLDDIMSKAFVSITVVGVVSLSIQVALNLPTLARTSDIPEDVDLGELTTGQETILQAVESISIPEPNDLTGLNAGQEAILQAVESISIPEPNDLTGLNAGQEAILRAVEGIAIPEPVDLTGVEAGQERILERVENILQANLIRVLRDLVGDQQLDNSTLAEAVGRTVGDPGFATEWEFGHYGGDATLPQFRCRAASTGWSCTIIR